MSKTTRDLSIIEYAIIRVACQAKEQLADPSLHLRGEIRKNLHSLRLGQELLVRLEREGLDLPPVDLSYPQRFDVDDIYFFL